MTMPLRVLMLEDQPECAEMVAAKLRQAGFAPDWTRVQNETEFLAHLDDPGLDLILADYNLPHFDALRALSRVQERNLNIPFIVITGFFEEEALECLKRGATDYLLKDRLGRLQQAVTHALETRRLQEEKRQIELALQERVLQYRLLFESNPHPMWVVDRDTCAFLAVNDAAVRQYGYSREQFRAMSLSDLGAAAEAADGTGAPVCPWYSGVSRHRRRDGTLVDVEVTQNSISFEHRNATLGLALDVSKRTRAEQNQSTHFRITRILAESATRAEAIPKTLQSICEGMDFDLAELWRADPDDRLRCEAVWRRTVEGPAMMAGYLNALAAQFEASSQKAALTRGMGLLGRVWKTGQPSWSGLFTDEMFLPSAVKTGLYRTLAFPITNGSQVSGVMALFNRQIRHPDPRLLEMLADIGSQFGQFEERKRAEEALRVSEEFNKRIIDSSNDSIMVLDLEGRVQYLSPGAQKLLDIGNATSRLNSPWLDFWEGPSKQAAREALSKAQAGDTGTFHGQGPAVDGFPRWWDVSVSPITDAQGNVERLLSVSRDITERKRLESHLSQAQKLESIGQLAAGVAHEINTPIQYVGDNTRFVESAFEDLGRLWRVYDKLVAAAKEHGLLSGQVAEAEGAVREVDLQYLREEIPKAIHQSLEGVQRVAEIVRAMKEFSHPGPAEKAAVDLNHAIQSTVLVSKNEWKYVAEMQVDLDPQLPAVRCFAGEINQVVLNLIVNAAHAVADAIRGKPEQKGTLTVSTRRDGDWAEIRVRDTGTGIPEAARPHIFNPFFTTKEVGKGTGQGLSIAHAVVVQKHGGMISFETETGAGTTFLVRLPIS